MEAVKQQEKPKSPRGRLAEKMQMITDILEDMADDVEEMDMTAKLIDLQKDKEDLESQIQSLTDSSDEVRQEKDFYEEALSHKIVDTGGNLYERQKGEIVERLFYNLKPNQLEALEEIVKKDFKKKGINYKDFIIHDEQ